MTARRFRAESLLMGIRAALDSIEQHCPAARADVGFLRGVMYGLLARAGYSESDARSVLKDYLRDGEPAGATSGSLANSANAPAGDAGQQ